MKLYLADVVVLAVEVGVGVQLPRHLVHGDEGGRGEVEDTAWVECFDHGIMGRKFPDGGLLRHRI